MKKSLQVVSFVSIFAAISSTMNANSKQQDAGFIPYLTNDQGQATAILMKKATKIVGSAVAEPVVYIEFSSGRTLDAIKKELKASQYNGFDVSDNTSMRQYIPSKYGQPVFALFVQPIFPLRDTDALKMYNKLKGLEIFGTPDPNSNFVEFTIDELKNAEYKKSRLGIFYYKITKYGVDYYIPIRFFEALARFSAFPDIALQPAESVQPAPKPITPAPAVQPAPQQQLSVEQTLTALQSALDSLGASISNP